MLFVGMKKMGEFEAIYSKQKRWHLLQQQASKERVCWRAKKFVGGGN